MCITKLIIGIDKKHTLIRTETLILKRNNPPNASRILRTNLNRRLSFPSLEGLNKRQDGDITISNMNADQSKEDIKASLEVFMLTAKSNTRKCLLALAIEEAQESEKDRRNRCRRERYARLTDDEKRRRTRKVPRKGTVQPSESPWQTVYDSGDISGMITVTGLDKPCFLELLKDFEPIFRTHSPCGDGDGSLRRLSETETRGKPRSIKAHACLGLTLFWTRTACHYWTMATYFGLTSSPCEKWLRFGKRVLLHVLKQRDDSKIRMPNEDKLREYVSCIEHQYPALNNVAFVGDGLKIPLEKASDKIKQNAYYNGWKGDHYITNLFVFAPDGTIVCAIVNAPGSMHDSDLASIGDNNVYSKLDHYHATYGVKCVMDSAFAASERQSIIKSIPRETIDTRAETAEQAIVWDQALSVRQSAEWGMRALQGSMPRLKARWHYEENDERLIGLTMIIHLYNYKANNMDLNQIRTVYWNAYQEGAVTLTANTS